MEPLWAMRALLWGAAATGTLFAAAVTRRNGGRGAAMFTWGGLLTTLLALDDAGQLHQVVLPSAVGVSEQLVCSVYVFITMCWVVRFRDLIATPASRWLLGSIFLFAAAIVAEHAGMASQRMLAQVFKLAGVACWTAFFAQTAVGQLRARRVGGELLSLSQQDQARAAREIDATAGAIAELAAMAKEASARRAEGRAAAAASRLSGVVESESVR